MNNKALHELKFRPLKKAMQQTFKRLRQAAQAGVLPNRRLVDEFSDQVRVMVSYPGFGDASYPELLAGSARLAAGHAQADIKQFKEALAAIVTLQARCHCPQADQD